MTFKNLSVDSPVNLGATYVFDKSDRRKIDEQIRELQAAMLDTSLTGQNLTTCRVASGTSFVAGDVCCLSGAPAKDDGIPSITIATAAHLVIAGAVLGVVMAAAPQDSLVLVALSGVLPPSITGLQTAGPVVCDSTGKLVHVAAFGSGDLKMGVADASLNLTLQIGVIDAGGGGGPVTFNNVKTALAGANTAVDYNTQQITGVAAGTAPGHAVNKSQLDVHVPDGWLNVRSFGAVGDGVTDDLPAFHAAIAAIRSQSKSTLYVPTGTYYLNGDLIIDQPCVLQGCSVGWFSNTTSSVLQFSAYHGILTHSILSSPTGYSAEYCSIRNLTVSGAHPEGAPGLAPDLHAKWQGTTAYVVGDKIVPVDNTRISTFAYNDRRGDTFEFYYECVKAGTTAATQPAWQPTGGFFVDRCKVWQASTAYNFAAVVRTPTRFDVAFKCVVPGYFPGGVFATSGGVIPAAFATAVIGDQIVDGGVTWLAFDTSSLYVTDGTVVWARRECAGIQCLTTTSVEHCTFQYFLNAGIFVQALSVFDSGYPAGLNPNFPEPTSIANVCGFFSSRILHCGVGVFCNSADSNAHRFEWLSVLGRLSNPRDTREIGISEQSFLGNYYDNLHVAGFGGPGYLIRGGVNSSTLNNVYVEGDCNPNEVFSQSAGVGFGGIKNAFTADSQFHGVAAPGDWRGVVGTSVTAAGVTINAYLKPDINSVFGWEQTTSEAFGGFKFTYQDAWSGRGWWNVVVSGARTSLGFSNQRAYEGFGHARFFHGFVAGNESGDKRYNFASAGGATDNQVRYGERVAGDSIRSNTYAVRGGFAERVYTTAGYEPSQAWFASSPVNSGNHTGPAASPSTMVIPSPANGFVYECSKSGTTSGAQPTWPTVVGSLVRSWVATGDYWVLNSYVRPSTPNGKIYKATSISGARPEAYSTTEPTWPTTLAATVVDAAGITWTCDSADPTTTYVADGTAVWTCIGVQAKSERAGFIVATGTLTTTNATPATLDTLPTLGTNSSKYYKWRVTAVDNTNQQMTVFEVTGCWVRGAGSATAVMPPTTTVLATNAATPMDVSTVTLTLASNVPTLTATGATGRTILWTSELQQ